MNTSTLKNSENIPVSKTFHQVLNILASGQSHSGESMGRILGVSRMAVSKAVKNLNQQGLKVNSLHGKGYQLESPVQLLDKDEIVFRLAADRDALCNIEVHQQLESTSDYLLDQSEIRDINRLVCLAENQNQGRGRRERRWLTTPYRNILMSIAWRFEDGMQSLSGLGIAAGITIARVLHEAGFDNEIGLKWPNDIIWHDRKLGGLLIDVRGEHDGPCLAVLGLGLNISLSEDAQNNIDQDCTSLEQVTEDFIDRNLLVTGMIRALTELFDGYVSPGFERFQRLWPDYDRFYGREVMVITGETSFSGIAMGIDEHGALLLDEGEESFSRFLSGDVSLRLAQ